MTNVESTALQDGPGVSIATDFLARWADGGPVQLTAIDPETKNVVTKYFATEAGRKAWIDERNGKGNLYFTVNPLRAPLDKKPKKTDIAALAWAHTDIDPRPGETPAEAKARALEALREFTTPPTVIIDSGGGIQAFWKLDTPQAVNGNIEELEAPNKALAKRLGGDHCHNIDRIMRLPGTINLPDASKRAKGRVATEARLLYFGDNAYDISELPELLPGIEEPQGANPSGYPTVAPFLGYPFDRAFKRRMGELMRRSRRFAATWEHRRPGLADQSLSSYDLALCSLAARADWGDPELAQLICAHRMQHGGPADVEKAWRCDYVTRTIGRARAGSSASTEDPRPEPPLHPGEGAEGPQQAAGREHGNGEDRGAHNGAAEAAPYGEEAAGPRQEDGGTKANGDPGVRGGHAEDAAAEQNGAEGPRQGDGQDRGADTGDADGAPKDDAGVERQQEVDSRAVIRIVGGQLPEHVRAAEQALLGFVPGPAIYQRAGRLCRATRLDIATDACGLIRPAGSLAILDADADFLMLQMTRAAIWQRFDKRTKKWRAVNAPREVALGMLASCGAWNFPPLRAIIEAPTLRPDGSVLDRPGYDPMTRILFDPGATDFGRIECEPTRDDARAALDTLAALLAGFPFVDPNEDAPGGQTVSFAVALSAILTAVIRPSIRTAPLIAFTAPVMASGKSLLVDVVAMIATGRSAAVMTYTDDSNEERKRLLSILLQSMPIIAIDNVAVPLESDALCSILTQETYRDRLLGASKTIEVPTCTTFLANGNNLAIKGDLATRALLCRLDPRCERPEERRFEVDLYTEIPRRRPELLRAALTIIHAYHVAGRPDLRILPFGRFETWSTMVRAPLVWAGLPDPCLSRAEVAKSDPTGEMLAALLTAWEACFGSAPTTTATAIATAKGDKGSEAVDLQAALEPFIERGEVNGRRLGNFLARHRDKIKRGLCFRVAGTESRRQWIARKVKNGQS